MPRLIALTEEQMILSHDALISFALAIGKESRRDELDALCRLLNGAINARVKEDTILNATVDTELRDALVWSVPTYNGDTWEHEECRTVKATRLDGINLHLGAGDDTPTVGVERQKDRWAVFIDAPDLKSEIIVYLGDEKGTKIAGTKFIEKV